MGAVITLTGVRVVYSRLSETARLRLILNFLRCKDKTLNIFILDELEYFGFIIHLIRDLYLQIYKNGKNIYQ